MIYPDSGQIYPGWWSPKWCFSNGIFFLFQENLGFGEILWFGQMGWRTTQLCMEDIEKTYKDPYVFFFFELAELLQIADDVFFVLREELPEEFRDRVLDFWCARKTKRGEGWEAP